MPVVECEVPQSSVLDRGFIQTAYFRDSYRVPLLNAQTSMTEIFFAIFGHRPRWMNLALILRNQIASFCGLDAPTASELLNPEMKGSYEPLLAEVCKFFKTGQPPVRAEQTIEVFAFMEAADESKRRGGAEVKIAELLKKAGLASPELSPR